MPQGQARGQEDEIAERAAGRGDADHRAEVDERLELAQARSAAKPTATARLESRTPGPVTW